MDFYNFLIPEHAEDLLSVREESSALRYEIELLPIDCSSNCSNISFHSLSSNTQIEHIMGFMDSLELPEIHKVLTADLEEKSYSKKGTFLKTQL